MNPVTNRPASVDTVKISRKPVPPVNQATIMNFSVENLVNIDPQRTPVSAYTKRVK